MGLRSGLLGCLFLVLPLFLGMCRGGDRNYPGGKRSGPKPKMDEESVAKRMKREASHARMAQRKAAAAIAAEQEEDAEQQKALLRKERSELPMCGRRSLGSERIADAKAAASSAANPASKAAASVAAQHKKNTLESFFLKP